MGNPVEMLNKFKSFVDNFNKNIGGDPRQKVQELLNSGAMSQQQFNELSRQANSILGKKMF